MFLVINRGEIWWTFLKINRSEILGPFLMINRGKNLRRNLETNGGKNLCANLEENGPETLLSLVVSHKIKARLVQWWVLSLLTLRVLGDPLPVLMSWLGLLTKIAVFGDTLL